MAEDLPIKEHDFSEPYIPPSIKVFGIAIGIFGLVLIWFEQLVGIIPMLFCIALLVTNHGYFFDFENKRFRHYFKVLNFKFGKWQAVDKPKGLLISKEIVKERSSLSFSGSSIKTKVKLWQVVIVNGEEEFFVTESEDIKQACTSALIMMAMFKVPAYSKIIRKDRMLDYQALRRGIVKFGSTVFRK